MSDGNLVYRVRNWDLLHETRASLRRTGALTAVKLTATLGRLVEQKLWLLPTGAAAYGIWIVMLRVAATCTRRGVLADDGVPLAARDFTALTGIPVAQIEDALAVLCGPEIRLLEQVPLEEALRASESCLEKVESPENGVRHQEIKTATDADRGRGGDSSELAGPSLPPVTTVDEPVPNNRKPAPPLNPVPNPRRSSSAISQFQPLLEPTAIVQPSRNSIDLPDQLDGRSLHQHLDELRTRYIQQRQAT